MNERLRDNYFVLMRVMLMLLLSCYGMLNEIDKADRTGVSFRILLLVSFYIGVMSVKELFEKKKNIILNCIGILIFFVLYYVGGESFYYLGFYTIYETMMMIPGISLHWFFLPLLGAFIDTSQDFIVQLIIIFMMAILYVQHIFVVRNYQKLMKEDVLIEQNLKKDLILKDYAVKAELKRNMLAAENQILEERTALSQTLHDKLGHSINGSIYQLEGVKVLMDKDPEKSRSMIQAVIDQLRTGMDEIRAILRKERPEKKEIALLQLYKLCEDCNSKGVEAELTKEGDLSQVSDELWEVILDNAFEAVSNSMKYAKCKHIDINLVIMNKMLRCSIKDDGVGCKKINDGMGISGMRQRVRKVNGTLSFETEAGFMVTMILPM